MAELPQYGALNWRKTYKKQETYKELGSRYVHNIVNTEKTICFIAKI